VEVGPLPQALAGDRLGEVMQRRAAKVFRLWDMAAQPVRRRWWYGRWWYLKSNKINRTRKIDLDVNVGLSNEIMEVYVPKLKCENLCSYGLENLWAPRINHCRHDSKKAHESFGNNYHHIYNMVRTNTLQLNDM
jgi:hypothetical protein